MTWYATEILARCNPALLNAVMGNPDLAAHSYLIREPVDYMVNGIESRFSPPEGGLLVVRPVCDPKTHCAEWHESAVLPWHALSVPNSAEAIQPQALGDHIDSDRIDEFPPAAFLSYLKRLSTEANARLAFFYCFMWGGETEFEYLWLFGEREEAAVVLQSGVTSKVAQVDAGHNIQLLETDLLSDALAYLGAPIPSPFWVPHTRGFPWEHYKLSGAGSGASASFDA
jgi:hypothetical protein